MNLKNEMNLKNHNYIYCLKEHDKKNMFLSNERNFLKKKKNRLKKNYYKY